MVELDFIKQNTVWVVKFIGHRVTCTGKDLSKYEDMEDVRDVDIAVWEVQPKELQEFYKDYEYAIYHAKRQDLLFIDDFYAEWSKDPKQFRPEMRPVIGKLSKMIENVSPYDDVIINNYDESTAGNHKAGNFIEALQELEVDFDVVDFYRAPNDDRDYIRFIVQTTDIDTFKQFSFQANKNAITHDPFVGDGKYSKR